MWLNKGIWLGSLVSLVAVTVATVPAAAQQPNKKTPAVKCYMRLASEHY
jgi:hypothetical protein